MKKEDQKKNENEILVPNEMEQVKESPWRSILKTISWRIVATATTFIIAYLVTGKVDDASKIASVEVVAKLIIYYLHERAWINIKWGKYWNRTRLIRRVKYNYIKYKRSRRK